jgi:hypothetical protein
MHLGSFDAGLGTSFMMPSLYETHIMYILCHNPSLGLATKARACKGVGQEGRPGVTSHATKSVGECEGMNPYTPK